MQPAAADALHASIPIIPLCPLDHAEKGRFLAAGFAVQNDIWAVGAFQAKGLTTVCVSQVEQS